MGVDQDLKRVAEQATRMGITGPPPQPQQIQIPPHLLMQGWAALVKEGVVTPEQAHNALFKGQDVTGYYGIKDPIIQS